MPRKEEDLRNAQKSEDEADVVAASDDEQAQSRMERLWENSALMDGFMMHLRYHRAEAYMNSVEDPIRTRILNILKGEV